MLGPVDLLLRAVLTHRKRSNEEPGREVVGLDEDLSGHLSTFLTNYHTEREDKLFRYNM
jgi:hypothetical protein